jgi:adenylate cyclase
MVCFLTVITVRFFSFFSVLTKSPVFSMGFEGKKKMTENSKFHSITIDLNKFRLHIDLKNRIELTLNFNSPSRKFYLSVIAFVVNEMKRLGKITSIPLEGHHDLLALLNETVGGSAGSSKTENLLPRIYRKWQQALPNLEEAPLFKIVGRKKEYDEGTGKAYPLTETEKDSWANLFEYKGSEKNVRLKFAVDRIGAGLDDVEIIYDGSLNGDAWDRFLSNLKGKGENLPETEAIQSPPEVPELPVSPIGNQKVTRQDRRRRIALAVLFVIISGTGVLAVWNLYFKPSPVKRASLERMAFPLPDKPSIAVLPFVNMSKDPEQEFFSDGLTEEIITTLSKSPHLFVIARSSTYKYKNKPVEPRQVSEELGVRYVLEGSVRRSGERIRITAQLIDAITGHYLWAERFDRETKEILTVQDEIALQIMKALHVELKAGQTESPTGRGLSNAEAYLKSMEAREQVLSYTKEGNARARQLIEEVIALDPTYARGYSGLAISYAADVWLGTSKSPKESLARAIEMGQKAVSLDGSDATAQAALAYLFALTRQYDKAVSQAERALSLDPNSYSVINNCGIALAYSGKHAEALSLIEKAVRLNPSIAQSFVISSMAYRIVGRYDEAYGEAKKAVERNSRSQLAQVALAATCILAGREEEAHAAAAEVLKINPTFSVEQYGRTLPFKDTRQIDLMTGALRKAGLK